MENLTQEQPCPLRARFGKEVIGRCLFDDLSFIHENDSIRGGACKSHFMRDHDHGHLVGKFLHHIQYFADHFRIQSGRWLIEEHQTGFHRQRSRNCHTLLLSARKLVGILITLIGKAYTGQELFRLSARLLKGSSAHACVGASMIFSMAVR